MVSKIIKKFHSRWKFPSIPLELDGDFPYSDDVSEETKLLYRNEWAADSIVYKILEEIKNTPPSMTLDGRRKCREGAFPYEISFSRDWNIRIRIEWRVLYYSKRRDGDNIPNPQASLNSYSAPETLTLSCVAMEGTIEKVNLRNTIFLEIHKILENAGKVREYKEDINRPATVIFWTPDIK